MKKPRWSDYSPSPRPTSPEIGDVVFLELVWGERRGDGPYYDLMTDETSHDGQDILVAVAAGAPLRKGPDDEPVSGRQRRKSYSSAGQQIIAGRLNDGAVWLEPDPSEKPDPNKKPNPKKMPASRENRKQDGLRGGICK